MACSNIVVVMASACKHSAVVAAGITLSSTKFCLETKFLNGFAIESAILNTIC